jgi:hypothetical protein
MLAVMSAESGGTPEFKARSPDGIERVARAGAPGREPDADTFPRLPPRI